MGVEARKRKEEGLKVILSVVTHLLLTAFTSSVAEFQDSNRKK